MTPGAAPVIASLALDLGKTACRAALWIGADCRTGTGPGAPGLAAPQGAALAEAAILAVVAPLLRAAGVARLESVGLGAAGALTAPDAARDLAENALRTARARLPGRKAALNALLSRAPDAAIDIPAALPAPRPMPEDDARLLALAAERHPELLALAREAAGPARQIVMPPSTTNTWPVV